MLFDQIIINAQPQLQSISYVIEYYCCVYNKTKLRDIQPKKLRGRFKFASCLVQSFYALQFSNISVQQHKYKLHKIPGNISI